MTVIYECLIVCCALSWCVVTSSAFACLLFFSFSHFFRSRGFSLSPFFRWLYGLVQSLFDLVHITHFVINFQNCHWLHIATFPVMYSSRISFKSGIYNFLYMVGRSLYWNFKHLVFCLIFCSFSFECHLARWLKSSSGQTLVSVAVANRPLQMKWVPWRFFVKCSKAPVFDGKQIALMIAFSFSTVFDGYWTVCFKPSKALEWHETINCLRF